MRAFWKIQLFLWAKCSFAKGHLISKSKFSCSHLNQKPRNFFFFDFCPSHLRVQVKKLYYKTILNGPWFKVPIFFWPDLFLGARAEIKKWFHSVLVQLRTRKFAFEINWSLTQQLGRKEPALFRDILADDDTSLSKKMMNGLAF